MVIDYRDCCHIAREYIAAVTNASITGTSRSAEWVSTDPILLFRSYVFWHNEMCCDSSIVLVVWLSSTQLIQSNSERSGYVQWIEERTRSRGRVRCWWGSIRRSALHRGGWLVVIVMDTHQCWTCLFHGCPQPSTFITYDQYRRFIKDNWTTIDGRCRRTQSEDPPSVMNSLLLWRLHCIASTKEPYGGFTLTYIQ